MDDEFTVDEALRIADQNADAYKGVRSVSRTLAAEVRRYQDIARAVCTTCGKPFKGVPIECCACAHFIEGVPDDPAFLAGWLRGMAETLDASGLGECSDVQALRLSSERLARLGGCTVTRNLNAPRAILANAVAVTADHGRTTMQRWPETPTDPQPIQSPPSDAPEAPHTPESPRQTPEPGDAGEGAGDADPA